MNLTSQINKVLEKYQPASHILISHIENLNDKVQESVHTSPLSESIMECDNFVEIVVEDLDKVLKIKPEWKQNPLLAED